MELRDLQALSALVKLGTTKSAALGIGVSQPTISRAVMQIEAHFGKQLFTRHRGRLLPTADAFRISESVEEIAGVLDFLQSDIGREEKGRSLRIAVTAGLGQQVLRPAILQFASMYPGIAVSISQVESGMLAGSLTRGELDLGLSVGPEIGEDLHMDILVRGALCCVVPKCHALGRRERIKPEHLRGETLIGIGGDRKVARLVDRMLQDSAVDVCSMIDVSCAHLACELVAGGMGIALVPNHPELLRPWASSIQVKPFHPAIEWNLCSTMPRSGSMQQTARQFCKLLQKTGPGTDLPTLQ
ncbi:MAG: LysR family transcriptional regulator [Janthinobacterium lividum]